MSAPSLAMPAPEDGEWLVEEPSASPAAAVTEKKPRAGRGRGRGVGGNPRGKPNKKCFKLSCTDMVVANSKWCKGHRKYADRAANQAHRHTKLFVSKSNKLFTIATEQGAIVQI